MANVRLSWTLPSVSGRQRPISHVLLESRVSDELPWTVIAEVPASANELLLEDVAPGEWQYRGSAVDDQGRQGPESVTTAAIEFDAPGALGAFVAAVE